MRKRCKCAFMLALASQVTLLCVYYALKDNTRTAQWNLQNILESKNGQKNSTLGYFLPARLREMFRWDDGSQEQSSTDAPSSQKYRSLVTTNEVVGLNTSKETRHEKPGMITTQIKSKAPTERPENQRFQRIDDKSAWIYSAFFDHVAAHRGKPMVRLIGIFREDLFLDLYCNFDITTINSVKTNATVMLIAKQKGDKQISGYIDCGLPANVRPTHVSISYQKNSTPTNRLQIIYPGTLIRNFTVCYSILHSRFDSSAQLIQSLEMNRILGAEHFVVYNYSISPAVDQILRRYQDDSLLTVIPWSTPTKEVHYFGQMAAMNDCLFRNRNVSRFVVYVDTDEFIIPRGNITWMELLDIISPQEHDVSAFIHPSNESRKGLLSTGSFEFRSSFFIINKKPTWSELPSEFPFSDEEKNNILKFKFLSLSQFWRMKQIYPTRDRTKYIARPDLVNITTVHYVESFVSNLTIAIDVPVSLALVHHYRSWVYKEPVLDTSILKFKHQLYSRIMQQCQRFSNIFG